MADDDNFDLDLYGDDGAQGEQQGDSGTGDGVAHEGGANGTPAAGANQGANDATQENAGYDHMESQQDGNHSNQDGATNGDSNGNHDERPIDPNASTAIQISDLQWYVSDDDIRGWARASGSEDELKDITFSEHKVNGKSRGQAYLEFSTLRASAALKAYLENPPAADERNPHPPKRHAVMFKTPGVNPFHTLPKDAPNRAKPDGAGMGRGGFQQGNSFRGRGGRGGGGFKPNSFNNGGAAAGGWMQGGFNGNGGRGGGGFGGGFGGMPMAGGMRGGRGGRGGMGGMPMMPGMMGMPGMMPGMGMPGFGGPGGFNPAFFGGGGGAPQQGGDWNPHGAKRPRPE